MLMIYELQVYIKCNITIFTNLQDSDHSDDNNTNYKICLYRGPWTPCGKMTHKGNLYQIQDQF